MKTVVTCKNKENFSISKAKYSKPKVKQSFINRDEYPSPIIDKVNIVDIKEEIEKTRSTKKSVKEVLAKVDKYSRVGFGTKISNVYTIKKSPNKKSPNKDTYNFIKSSLENNKDIDLFEIPGQDCFYFFVKNSKSITNINLDKNIYKYIKNSRISNVKNYIEGYSSNLDKRIKLLQKQGDPNLCKSKISEIDLLIKGLDPDNKFKISLNVLDGESNQYEQQEYDCSSYAETKDTERNIDPSIKAKSAMGDVFDFEGAPYIYELNKLNKKSSPRKYTEDQLMNNPLNEEEEERYSPSQANEDLSDLDNGFDNDLNDDFTFSKADNYAQRYIPRRKNSELLFPYYDERAEDQEITGLRVSKKNEEMISFHEIMELPPLVEIIGRQALIPSSEIIDCDMPKDVLEVNIIHPIQKEIHPPINHEENSEIKLKIKPENKINIEKKVYISKEKTGKDKQYVVDAYFPKRSYRHRFSHCYCNHYEDKSFMYKTHKIKRMIDAIRSAIERIMIILQDIRSISNKRKIFIIGNRKQNVLLLG